MADFEVDITVTGDGNVVTLIIPDLLRNDGGLDAYVLEVCHGCAEVEHFDVEAKIFFTSEMVLLMYNLASSMETAGELAWPGQSSLSPLAVMRT